MYIYKRVRDLREDHDFSRQSLAEKLGEHLTTYQRWETGETEIPCHIIIKLSELYNVTTDYLLGISDSPSPTKK